MSFMAQKTNNLKLFVGTFVSTLLLIVGAGTLLLMVVPVLAEKATTEEIQWPQLPLSADVSEPYLDVNSIPPRAPYPPLAKEEIATGYEGDFIRIPALDITVPLALSPSIEDKDVLATLTSGAALYPNGIQPGHLGNVFIAAHSTGEPWKGKYRFAFSKINELESGHLIHLDYKGTRYTYRVFKSELVKPTNEYRVQSDRPRPTVTLMACWPLWSTSQRMLVWGELANITKLTNSPT